MPEFDDVYKEDNGVAKLSVGEGGLKGKITVNGTYMEEERREMVEVTGSLITLDGDNALLSMGAWQRSKPGKIDLGRITIDAAGPIISMGGNSGLGEGKIILKHRLGTDAITLDAAEGEVSVGAQGQEGRIKVCNNEGVVTAEINGNTGDLTLGGGGKDGDIALKSSSGETTARIDGQRGDIFLGGGGVVGNIFMRTPEGETSININGRNGSGNASVTVGGVGAHGEVVVKNDVNVPTIRMTGEDGDIHFLNADFAEEFSIAPDAMDYAVPGMVMSLSDDGDLVASHTPYDQKVVGVIAGAGDYRPALILDKQGGENRLPVAMVGKVYCMVSAEKSPIRVGDLLTTSDLLGHAVKVEDRSQALGAVIGKALAPLESGTGMIPVLVNLQ